MVLSDTNRNSKVASKHKAVHSVVAVSDSFRWGLKIGVSTKSYRKVTQGIEAQVQANEDRSVWRGALIST